MVLPEENIFASAGENPEEAEVRHYQTHGASWRWWLLVDVRRGLAGQFYPTGGLYNFPNITSI